jgi:alpha-glucosidase
MTTLMMCLRGSACVYQGEELGLREADVAFADLQDPYGIEFWPEFKGRDGCRTPMVWEASNANGGFSNAAKPWLPVSHEHTQMSVAVQEEDPDALIHHYRRAIALRHANLALATGDHDGVKATDNIVHFTRTLDADEIFCAFNLGDTPAELAMPKGTFTAIAFNLGCVDTPHGDTLTLGPWQAYIATAGRT